MYPVKFYPFTEHPKSDSCWALSVGPDGRIYAGACCEMTGGETVELVRYDDKADKLEYLLELDKVVEDPRDSGRATQCKIHYSFAPSMADGVLYMVTHLSGPPVNELLYCGFNGWHEKTAFRGAAVVAYDTRAEQVLWWDTALPREGCRCLVIDEPRGLLYMLSYPRDHLFVYDLKTRKCRDLGRIGSINSQILLLDASHRVWSTRDDGRMVRYDPAKDRIEVSPNVLPHDPVFQNGWHSVFYDAAAAPDGKSIFGVAWFSAPRLWRIWLDEGEWERVEDLGPATQARSPYYPDAFRYDHVGGLTFGGDGQLYYVATRWRDAAYGNEVDSKYWPLDGAVVRVNIESYERETVALLDRMEAPAQYVSRGATDRNGDLFFAHVGWSQYSDVPVGIYKVELPAERKRANAHLPIRIWG